MAAVAKSLKIVGKPLEVTLGREVKGMSCANDARKLFAELLERSNYAGHWVITPLKQQRGTSRTPRFEFMRQDEHGAIHAKLRPGGNDTVWEYTILPPREYGLASVVAELQRWNGWDGNTSGAEVRQHEAEVETKASSIVERINALEARARNYREGQKRVAELEKRYDNLLAEAGVVEQQIAAAKEAIAADYEGAQAIAALEQLERLVK